MRLFSRNNEAIEAGPPDVPFGVVKRTPRRKGRAPLDGHRDAQPLDPAETSKTRARRRLIGAVTLALAAIVFVPMLFDRTPVVTPDDVSLQIPDRDTPFEGRRGVPDTTRGPLKPAADLPVVAPSSAAPPPVVQAAPPAIADAAEAPADKTAETPAPPAVPAKPVDKTPAKAVAAPPPDKPQPPTDDPKALAALEGHSDAPAEAAGKSFAVQIAAYSSADKAKSMRDQLVANGMKSYTESVSTTQGLRTRVRLGPFASRDAADRAREKLRTMKLDGSVVPL
jgi:DedD protein